MHADEEKALECLAIFRKRIIRRESIAQMGESMRGKVLFLPSFLADDPNSVNEQMREFLDGLGTTHNFSWAFGSRDLPTGVPSRFLDIYPEGVVEKYDSFGIVYVRLWLVGRDPQRLLIGIFLGAARAEQAEPRRAAGFVRHELEDLIDPLERERGFQYKTWGDADIWWREEGMSVRAVTRQFEQFMTYRATQPDDNNLGRIEEDIGHLVQTVDAAIGKLDPIREFGKNILLLYYGENLPAAIATSGDQFADMVAGTDEQAQAEPQLATPQTDVMPDWFSNLPAIAEAPRVFWRLFRLSHATISRVSTVA